jgi:hypothetical protein
MAKFEYRMRVTNWVLQIWANLQGFLKGTLGLNLKSILFRLISYSIVLWLETSIENNQSGCP